MYRFMHYYSTLFDRLVSGFPLASWCAQVVGVVLRTPGLLHITILCDVSFNFA